MTAMSVIINSILADFPMTILPKIIGELTRDQLINMHCLVCANTESVKSNLRGGVNGNLALILSIDEY